MNKTVLIRISICLVLIGVGSLLLAGMDMERTAAARPNVWLEATSLPQPLAANLVQCPDDRDSFYMVGGILAGDITTDKLIRYDINTASWDTNLRRMPAPRRAVAAACYQSRIYVAGGLDENGYIWESLFIYDIANNTWTTGPSMPHWVWGAVMGAWDGKLYVIGGNQAGYPYAPVNFIYVYDIFSGEWTLSDSHMPEASCFAANTQVGPYLYIVGGYSGDFNHNVDQTQRYDMSYNEWQTGPTFTGARALGQLAATETHIYMLGGDQNGGTEFDPTDVVDMLDISTWPNGAWTDLGDPLPLANLYPASTCSEALSGGEIWDIGGVDNYFNFYDGVYYRPTEPCTDFYFGDLPREEWELGNHPGAAAHYVLPVINNGTLADSYDVTITSTWVITAPDAIGPIEPGEAGLLMVDVLVPADAEPDDFDSATVTITSQGDPDASDSAVLTTSVTDWQEAASLPQPLAFQTKAQCADDPTDFYIIGGSNYWLYPISTIYHFDGIAWSQITYMPYPWSMQAAVCYNQKLYIAGGDQARLDVYDIIENTWTNLTAPPRYVWGAGMAAWDGQLFLVGGEGVLGSFLPTNETNIYDIASDTWSVGPPLPTASFVHGYAQTGPNFYVVGGLSGDFNNNLNITYRLNLAIENAEWEQGPSFSSRRAGLSLAATQSHLYAYGGDMNGFERLDATGLVEALDLSLWPEGAWEDIHQPMPWALEGNGGGFCTDTVIGSNIWSVGGMTGIWMPSGWYEIIDSTYYLPIGEPCVQNIVNLPDTPMYGEGEVGSTVYYTIPITNTGNVVDYYNLFISNTGPGSKLLGGPGPVDPGDTIDVVIGIEVPFAPAGDVITSTVRVESLRDPNIMDGMQIFTTVLLTFKPEVGPELSEMSGMYGEIITYTLTVKNAGNITDTIALTSTGNTWEVRLSTQAIELGAGESAEIWVSVTIPEEAWVGDSDMVSITATSTGDPSKMDEAELVTTAFWYRTLIPLALKN